MRRPVDRRKILDAAESAELWAEVINAHDFNLSGSNLSNAIFENIDFSRLDLEGCEFSNSQLIGCRFQRSNLYGCSFEGANLHECTFLGALLTNSNFQAAEISDSDFSLAELSGVFSNDATLDRCDLSRARGLDQTFLDRCVGDSGTIIPASLDYPEHWLTSNEERIEQSMLNKLRAYRGDEVLFCTFNGQMLLSEKVAQRDQFEVISTIKFLQQKVQRIIDEKFLHNESPALYRAIEDYFISMTSSAGENRRWPLKHYEIDQIRFGLEGNCVAAHYEAVREDLQKCAPEKLPIVEQIIGTHLILLSNLESWRRYVGSVVDAQINQDQIHDLAGIVDRMIVETQVSEHFDDEIPRTLVILRSLMTRPLAVARSAAMGTVRAVESLVSALFTFSRRFIQASSDDALDFGSKLAVRGTIAVLIAGGAPKVLSMFPHLSGWFSSGMNVLKSLGLLP